jgi:hypothetical protein
MIRFAHWPRISAAGSRTTAKGSAGTGGAHGQLEASALSQLNFRVDRGKFAAAVADLHLPVDAALAAKANIGKFIWDAAIGFAVLARGH